MSVALLLVADSRVDVDRTGGELVARSQPPVLTVVEADLLGARVADTVLGAEPASRLVVL